MHESQFGHGIDVFHALIQAIEGCRAFLERSGKKFLWEGGEGETGIPIYVPTFYSKDFTDDLLKLINSEMESFAQSAERRCNSKATKICGKRTKRE